MPDKSNSLLALARQQQGGAPLAAATTSAQSTALKPYETIDGKESLIGVRGPNPGLIGYYFKGSADTPGRTLSTLRVKPSSGNAYYDITTDIDTDQWNSMTHEQRNAMANDYITKADATEKGGQFGMASGLSQAVPGLGLKANRVSIADGANKVATSEMFDINMLSREEQQLLKDLDQYEQTDEILAQKAELKRKGTRKTYQTTDGSAIQ
jgi:hypothetical protein